LFRGKSNDEEDEGTALRLSAKARAGSQMASSKSAEPVPTPRAKPQAATTFQLASADAQIVQPPGRSRPRRFRRRNRAQTPADIINARGFWGDAPATPKQATPAQVAAISARQALAAADPQPTASVSALQALAYAPAAASPVDRSNIVAASAPIRTASAPPRPAQSGGRHRNRHDRRQGIAGSGQGGSNRDAAFAAAGNDIWMR